MSIGVDEFLKKHNINPRDIIYIIKENGKTAVYLKNGKVVYTIIPTKNFRDFLPELLISVNKGVLLAANHIVNISSGIYTMSDGSVHKGRVRTPGQHKRNRDIIARLSMDYNAAEDIRRSFSVLDKSNLPFFVIELVFDSSGRGVDYIIRYCNQAFVKLVRFENEDEIIDHSFYEVTGKGDKNWAILLTETALNGTSLERKLQSLYTESVFLVSTFQPFANYCACTMVRMES